MADQCVNTYKVISALYGRYIGANKILFIYFYAFDTPQALKNKQLEPIRAI